MPDQQFFLIIIRCRFNAGGCVGVCPICPLDRFFIRGRNILFQISRGGICNCEIFVLKLSGIQNLFKRSIKDSYSNIIVGQGNIKAVIRRSQVRSLGRSETNYWQEKQQASSVQKTRVQYSFSAVLIILILFHVASEPTYFT